MTKWLKCSERLPEEHKTILLFFPKDFLSNPKYLIGWLRITNDGTKLWDSLARAEITNCDSGLLPFHWVTHWQELPPLPEAPKDV